MQVIKRNGEYKEFDPNKIVCAIKKASANIPNIKIGNSEILGFVDSKIACDLPLEVEEIQDRVETWLMANYPTVAKLYIIYREKHKEIRFIKGRAEYIESYTSSCDNAAEASEVDANANVQNKNVATLEAELYKTTNMEISRYRIVEELKREYGALAPNYVADLISRIIYKHDENSAPAIKPYCVAVNMYPFLNRGTSSLDRLNTTAPQNLNSFCGQFNNLVFLLSSQFQGAVAFAEFFNVFTYYCIKEWGEDFMEREDEIVAKSKSGDKSISNVIEQSFQNIVYTINQPAGNRSFQSPFTNVSYFDRYYWSSMFDDFVFPDGSKVSYEQVNYIQQKFMKWFNAERKKCLLTFPVETVAMLHDGSDFLDQEWKEFTAEMYAEGHSFFTYISDNADSLSSCCRLRNAIKPEFSFTSGNVGVATGSKSVITINLNRFIQEKVKDSRLSLKQSFKDWDATAKATIIEELKELLSRIYKYHEAYNNILIKLQKNKMLPVYDEGYISLQQQFLTIGINGCNEAAMVLGIEICDSAEYREFCALITSTISSENSANSTKELRFNTEFVPAEGLGVKNYDWDKADGYWVPEDRNCYTSYFFLPDDPKISLLDQMRLHGRHYTDTLDGGVALHANLEDHLSKAQYLKILDIAIKEGTSYFTFNIPNSSCDKCGYITKTPIDKCPKCNSDQITYWTRIIGYLRPVKGFSKGRRVEASKRVYNKAQC
ncbi:MAG: anaerobic ribonucleoside-triphosphate reductase [Rikenellaceae bacterium]